MLPNLDELCCLLVEEFYGEFHSHLFSYLTDHGRLSAPELAQKSHIPIGQVKSGLANLIQQRLVLHHTNDNDQTSYQADTDAAYQLLRSGKLIQLANSRLGETPGTVLSEAVCLGFSTIAELEANSFDSTPETLALDNNSHDNSDADADAARREGIREAVRTLLDHNYLIRLRFAHLQPESDVKQDAKLHLQRNGQLVSSKGKNAASDLERQIQEEYDRRVSTDVSEYGHLGENTAVRTNGNSATNARNGSPDKSTLISVNFANVVRKVRDEDAVGLAKERLGSSYGAVLEAALAQVPVKERWMRTNDNEVKLELRQLRDKLNSEFDGFTYDKINERLASIAEVGFDFLLGSRDQGWKIDRRMLKEFAQRREIERFIKDQFGSKALRIIRMLVKHGKLNEKTIQEMGLMTAKDTRTTLSALKMRGFIDTQEVPREAQRQPKRTMYFEFYDPERAVRVVLADVYQTMARVLQRLKSERLQVMPTLEKSERSDVRGREAELMSSAEVEVLNGWRRKEGWMIAMLSRLDESVALLRDL